MGMFDEVNFKMGCPKCGKPVSGFQTKDLDCTMDMVEPDAIRNFYSSCRECGTWIEFSRVPSRTPPRETPLSLDEVKALGFTMISPGSAALEEPHHAG